VARAYDVLTEEGYLMSIPKKGCFVASGKTDKNAALRAVLKEAIEQGTTPEEIKALIDDIAKGDKS
jgi:DNA-binding transcriptional regulator YhcF (GntR family)